MLLVFYAIYGAVALFAGYMFFYTLGRLMDIEPHSVAGFIATIVVFVIFATLALVGKGLAHLLGA